MTDNELQEFVEDELPNVAIGDVNDPLNFVTDLVSFLQGWMTAYGASLTVDQPAYCCFVQCDRVTQVADSNGGFSLQRYFRDDTPQNLLGRIYLSSATLQMVYSKCISVASLEEVQREIEILTVSPQVVVIFNAASKRAFWRTGTDTNLSTITIPGESPEKLHPEDFDTELDQFHLECTATPSGLAQPWKNASKFIPRERLENGIRDSLCLFLRPRNKKSLLVIRESFEPTGRADLKVFFIAEKVIYFLELKVLRIKESSGVAVKKSKMVEWAKEGIVQAHTYREANDPSGVAYACCYDARGTDEEIVELVEFASAHNVIYRRYFMYPSAKEYRAPLVS